MVVMIQSYWFILGDLHRFNYFAISGASSFKLHDVVISSPGAPGSTLNRKWRQPEEERMESLARR